MSALIKTQFVELFMQDIWDACSTITYPHYSKSV